MKSAIVFAALAVATFSPVSGQILETIYSFRNSDGAFPIGLTETPDGSLVGVTESGGMGYGTAFRIKPDGTFESLANFVVNGKDGYHPSSAVILARDGNFYGTTSSGGKGFGTVFRLSPSGSL